MMILERLETKEKENTMLQTSTTFAPPKSGDIAPIVPFGYVGHLADVIPANFGVLISTNPLSTPAMWQSAAAGLLGGEGPKWDYATNLLQVFGGKVFLWGAKV